MTEWKGRPTGICGSRYKVGMVMHPNTLCRLPRFHLGKHMAGSMLQWEKTPQETEAMLEEMDRVRERAGV